MGPHPEGAPSSWLEQRQRWRRFEAWEDGYLRSTARGYALSLAWMADAWELASRHHPGWNGLDSAATHWRHLAEIQRRLARARLRP